MARIAPPFKQGLAVYQLGTSFPPCQLTSPSHRHSCALLQSDDGVVAHCVKINQIIEIILYMAAIRGNISAQRVATY